MFCCATGEVLCRTAAAAATAVGATTGMEPLLLPEEAALAEDRKWSMPLTACAVGKATDWKEEDRVGKISEYANHNSHLRWSRDGRGLVRGGSSSGG